MGLPPMLTATTGMDALTHAVEAYIGGSTTRRHQGGWPSPRCASILESLPVAWENGGDLTACAKMLRAAYLAGTRLHQELRGLRPRGGPLPGRPVRHRPTAWPTRCCCPSVLEAYGPACHNKRLGRLAVAAGVAQASDDTPAAGLGKIHLRRIREMNAAHGDPPARWKASGRRILPKLARTRRPGSQPPLSCAHPDGRPGAPERCTAW